jgi:hypothetical protein
MPVALCHKTSQSPDRASVPAAGPAVKNGNHSQSNPQRSEPSRWPPPALRISNPREPQATTAGRPARASSAAALPPRRARKRPQPHHGPSDKPMPAHPRPRGSQGPIRGHGGERPARRVGYPTRSRDPKMGNALSALRVGRGARGEGAGLPRAVGGVVAEGRRRLSQLGVVCGTGCSLHQREIRGDAREALGERSCSPPVLLNG